MSQSSFRQAPEPPQAWRSQPATQLGPPPPAFGPPPSPGPERRPRHKKLRLVLIVIGALLGSLIGYSLVSGDVDSGGRTGPAGTSTSERTTDAIAPGDTRTLSAFDLQDGDCYSQAELPPPDGSTVPISSVEVTSCESAHNAQVIAKVVFKAIDDFEDVRDNKAGQACDGEFRNKVSPNILADTAYKSVILSPADQSTWARRPVVACVLVTETPKTGSALIA